MLAHKVAEKDPQTGAILRELGWRITKNSDRPEQTLPMSFISRMQAEGVCTVGDDRIVFDTIEGEVAFVILSKPGCFCTIDGAEIPYEWNAPNGSPQRGAAARAYVAEHHADADFEGAGYLVKNGYRCKLEA